MRGLRRIVTFVHAIAAKRFLEGNLGTVVFHYLERQVPNDTLSMVTECWWPRTIFVLT